MAEARKKRFPSSNKAEKREKGRKPNRNRDLDRKVI